MTGQSLSEPKQPLPFGLNLQFRIQESDQKKGDTTHILMFQNPISQAILAVSAQQMFSKNKY
jgi:hypothetical protein